MHLLRSPAPLVRRFAVWLPPILLACGGAPHSDVATAKLDTAAWLGEIAAQTALRNEWIPSATGPLAQVALCRVDPKSLPITIGADPMSGCSIPGTGVPDRIGNLVTTGDTLSITGAGAITWLGEASLRNHRVLAVRNLPQQGGAEAWQGAVRLTARWAESAITLWGLDTLAEARAEFKGIDRWPTNLAWRIKAHFVASHHDWRMVPTVRGFDLPREVAGTVVAEIGGESRHLTAYSKGRGATSMLVVIRDLTSGDGSYPAGRFLDVPLADSLGGTVLDFNLARNPDCAFTTSSPCPLPPRENWFTTRLEVGEKAYHTP